LNDVIAWTVQQMGRTDLPCQIEHTPPTITGEGGEKFNAVANYVDNTWRSMNEIARTSGISISVVQRSLRRLVAQRYVECLPGRSSGKGRIPDQFRRAQ